MVKKKKEEINNLKKKDEKQIEMLSWELTEIK